MVLGSAAFGVATASASFDTYMGQQGLSAGNAYASSSAHTGIYQSGADVDHTACPGYAEGWGGYTSNNQAVWWTNINPGSGYHHGAVYNPNNVTFDNFTWAIYYW